MDPYQAIKKHKKGCDREAVTGGYEIGCQTASQHSPSNYLTSHQLSFPYIKCQLLSLQLILCMYVL